jgi:uncharacterized membrane protein
VGGGCEAPAGLVLPYDRGLPPDDQPHSLYGLDYMTWSAYCDHDTFIPLAYDYEAIRWLQDNVQGSPVIVEGYLTEYKIGARYTWNTGLPAVLGWNYHTRQHNATIPTDFVWQRATAIDDFYSTSDLQAARDFLRRYAVGYIVVGPLEHALYGFTGGLAKFDALTASGELTVAHRNDGVTLYQVSEGALASQ